MHDAPQMELTPVQSIPVVLFHQRGRGQCRDFTDRDDALGGAHRIRAGHLVRTLGDLELDVRRHALENKGKGKRNIVVNFV